MTPADCLQSQSVTEDGYTDISNTKYSLKTCMQSGDNCMGYSTLLLTLDM